MTKKQIFESVLERYGKPLCVKMGTQSHDVKAFLEPLRYQNKMYLDYENYDLGLHDNTCLLYIGPADPDISLDIDSAVISDGGRAYMIKRADRMSIGEEPIYVRAVLVPRYLNGGAEFV